ncbi:MAG: preprotein translocase subunit SecE [Chloroflexi bacterium]|nr:preprotein translocase subunit SecE [Chloroflexota bacterium]MQC25912.1 preprotein translocase subunit SecE [Chloroflexota bacterium]
MAGKKQKRSEQNAVSRYFRETRGELSKVSWPTRREAIGLTQVVILVMILMGAILGSLDWVFFRFFANLLGT